MNSERVEVGVEVMFNIYKYLLLDTFAYIIAHRETISWKFCNKNLWKFKLPPNPTFLITKRYILIHMMCTNN